MGGLRVRLETVSGLAGQVAGPAPSRRVGGYRRAPGSPSWCRDGFGWSAGREGLQAGDCGGDFGSPGPAGGEAQPAGGGRRGNDAPGGGEQAQPQAIGFPSGRSRPGRASASRPATRRPARRSRTRPHSCAKPWRGRLRRPGSWHSGSCPRTLPAAGGVVPGQRFRSSPRARTPIRRRCHDRRGDR